MVNQDEKKQYEIMPDFYTSDDLMVIYNFQLDVYRAMTSNSHANPLKNVTEDNK